MMQLRWGSATDVGMVRDINQDNLLVAEPLFAVADGMGGHQGGEVASATALEILERTFRESATKEELLEAVRRANAKVWDRAQLDDNLHGMGTTLTAAAVFSLEDGGEVVAVVNIGDSRTYLLRDGELIQLTTDHSFVEEMVRAGEISAEEAESHPKRNILTRALGVEPTVEPQVEEMTPRPGDRLLLCSDGLIRELNDNQIAAHLRKLKDPDEAAKELVAQAKAHGGHDNITVVIVDFDVESEDVTVHIDVPSKDDKRKGTNAQADYGRGNKIRPSAPRGRNPVTLRVIVFIFAVVALVGVGMMSVVWYARSSYFVGLEGEQLVIYQGRPEPVLWYEATIVQRTNVLTSDVLPSALPTLRDGALQSSLQQAQTYVENLKSEADEARGEQPSDVPTTTPTTALTTTPPNESTSTTTTTAVP